MRHVLKTAFALSLGLLSTTATARDDGRYSNNPLHDWFEQLRSDKGRCCSDADGRAVSDVDWVTKDGHYIIYLEGEWRDVPDEAVIKGPNLSGKTMVWPVYHSAYGGPLSIDIVCFMPGSMT